MLHWGQGERGRGTGWTQGCAMVWLDVVLL